MKRRPDCLARQQSDQMACGQCGLAWDVNDSDPPACRSRGFNRVEAFKRLSLGLDKPDGHAQRVGASFEARVPVELPLELAERMAAAYRAAYPGAAAIRAAWRVFVDEVGQ